jgi:hypothetical protein
MARTTRSLSLIFLSSVLLTGLSACNLLQEKPRFRVAEPGYIRAAVVPESPEGAETGKRENRTPPASTLATQFAQSYQTLRAFDEYVRISPWRPLRYFGPFRREDHPEFDQIQILFDKKVATWYYNQYFTQLSSDQQSVYKRYYQTSWGPGSSFDAVELPANTTETLAFEPGGHEVLPSNPTAEYFGATRPVLLALNRIEYTSRYGGSIRLVFTYADVPGATVDLGHAEDFEYEFAAVKDISDVPNATEYVTYLFDVGKLELSVFVSPKPKDFNPIGYGDGSVLHVESSFDDVVAYEKGTQISPIDLAANDNALAALAEVLKQLGSKAATATVSGALKHASRLTLGFLHDQFNRLLPLDGPRDEVKSVAISDDYIDFQTGTRDFVFWVRFRIHAVWLDSEWGDEEISVRISALHAYKGDKPSFQKPGRTYELKRGQGTSWYSVGAFRVDECSDILNLTANVLVDEQDVAFDDDYGYYIHFIFPDCERLEAAANAEPPLLGMVKRAKGIQTLYAGTSSTPSGAYAWSRETYLTLR